MQTIARSTTSPAARVCRQRPFTTAAPVRSARAASRGALQCRAEFSNKSFTDTVGVMLQKYDFLSTAMGAAVVTGYCWAKGQDPFTALGITAASTVAALVANELFFSDDRSKQA